MKGMNSNPTASRHEYRPRLRVLLPLLLVCFAVIFLSIRDRLHERSERQAESQKYGDAEPATETQAGLRQIPQRLVAPPFLGKDHFLGDNAPSAQFAPETDAVESGADSTPHVPVTIRAAPFVAAVGLQTAGGTIAGHVTLNGVPSRERDIVLDPSCARLRAEKMTTRFFVVDERGGLGDVVVAVEPLQNAAPLFSPPRLQPVLLDQVGCEFVPYVLGLHVGQTLLVRNSDPVLHDVHISPNTSGNKELNRAHLAGSPDLELKFDAPEFFLRIKCDVHPWMFAYVSVFEHSYFAITQPDGNFQITNVPVGEYTLVAAHRKLPKMIKPVTVRNRETSTIDFTLDVATGSSP